MRQVATLQNRHGVVNDEDGLPILPARGMTSTWSEVWPRFRHYD